MSGTLAAQLFLMRLKPLLAARKLAWKPRNRRKTREFMLAEGLSEEDAYEIIANLKPEYYAKGPEPDDDESPGAVMVFYQPYTRQAPPGDEILLYIKLKIWADPDTGEDAGIVMSFHDEGNI
jgi:hypothetical protein